MTASEELWIQHKSSIDSDCEIHQSSVLVVKSRSWEFLQLLKIGNQKNRKNNKIKKKCCSKNLKQRCTCKLELKLVAGNKLNFSLWNIQTFEFSLAPFHANFTSRKQGLTVAATIFSFSSTLRDKVNIWRDVLK